MSALPERTATFVPAGFVCFQDALGRVYDSRLGPGAEIQPQSKFDAIDDEIRQRLYEGKLMAWIFTSQGEREVVPKTRWGNTAIWSQVFHSLPFELDQTNGAPLKGQLLLSCDDAEQLLSGESQQPCDLISLAEWPDFPISPYMKLMLRFSKARQSVFGDRRYLKKEVVQWFADHWPDELEKDWPIKNRKSDSGNDKNCPRVVSEMAGLVFMTSAERKGGKQKGQRSPRLGLTKRVTLNKRPRKPVS